MDHHNTQLISGFPGVGKSYFHSANLFRSDRIVTDSDSSEFPKDKFPDNYMEFIKNTIGFVDIIMISSHAEIREALVQEGLMFTLIYPDISLKEEYIKRFEDRGNSSSFIKLLKANWETWICELMAQEGCIHVILQQGEYLSDKIT